MQRLRVLCAAELTNSLRNYGDVREKLGGMVPWSAAGTLTAGVVALGSLATYEIVYHVYPLKGNIAALDNKVVALENRMSQDMAAGFAKLES